MPPKKKHLPVFESDIKLIRKANELVEARYKFDIWETRVFAFMLTQIKSNDTDFNEYRINTGDIVKEFNLHDSGQVYESIKNAADKLLDKKVEILRTTPEGQKEVFKTHLVASTANPEENSKENYIKLSFHPALKPFLLELKERYLVYDIRNILSLTSIYSVRLFELLKQYQKIGKRKFRVDELKSLLSIEPNEYQLYGHFKGVLKRTEKDLLTFTDIYFTLEEEIYKKKVIAITFNIYENAKNKRTNSLVEPEKKQLIQSPLEISKNTEIERIHSQVENYVSKQQVKKWVRELPLEQIENGIRYTINYIQAGNKIDNIGGFLNKVVYTPNLYDKYEEKKSRAKRVTKKQQVLAQQIESKLAELKQIRAEMTNELKTLEERLFSQDTGLYSTLTEQIKTSAYYDRNLTFEENIQRDNIIGLRGSILQAMYPEYDTIITRYELSIKAVKGELELLGYRG